jgi:RHS repeat-associated protein
MKKHTHFLVNLLAWVAVCMQGIAQDNPLWENVAWESVPLMVIGEETPAGEEPMAMALADGLAETGDGADPDIQALADALGNDPVAIFNHVRNTIDYEHYYGLRKGARLTLLEGGGNDFDQCALLAELLKAAGYSDVQFRLRRQLLSYEDLAPWLGLAEEPYPGQTFEEAYGLSITNAFPNGQDQGVGDLKAKQAFFAQKFLSARGSIADYFTGTPVWFPDFPSQATVVSDRLFVVLTVDGTAYELDPSYKTYEPVAGVDGMLAAMEYDRSALLSAAGGSATAQYVQSLSQSGISGYLNARTTDWLDFISENHPELSLQEIASGRRIVKQEIADLSEAFPLPARYWSSSVTWTEIPDNRKTTVRFLSGAMDYTIPTSDLEGRKISLTFSGNTVELRLDDGTPVATRTVSGSSFDLTITVAHAGNLPDKSETKSYKKNDAFAYAILYGFSPSGRLLQKRQEQLNAYLDQGLADDSKEVRSELLNVMGLTWLYQTELASQLLAARNGISTVRHHRFGRMGQEEGFYVDVGLQQNGSLPLDDVRDERFDNVFHLGGLFASAMEHGVIEQMQPGSSAVSTVNLLREANRTGKKLYRADSTNWNSVKTVLQSGGYPAATLTDLGDFYNSSSPKYAPETKLFLPQNYSIRPKLPDGTSGNWQGSGWVIRNNSKAGMIISGGYSGGYSYQPPGSGNTYVNSPPIITSSIYNPTYTYNPPVMPTVKPYVPAYQAPQLTASDPVDMASGAFLQSQLDLETGLEAAPRGLRFARDYSSAMCRRDSQRIGYGWTHSLHMRATVRTANEEALGMGSARQAAALLTSTMVAADLYRSEASVKEWGVAAMTVGWFQDELLKNAVAITVGNQIVQFIEQPDGSYEPPAGSTMTLTKSSGNYVLSQRHGNTITFEPANDPDDDEAQRAKWIDDPDGRRMSLVYHSDGKLNYVQDHIGRRYTLTYNAAGRIERVTDSTDGRFVEFTYDMHGNLTQATDPEGKHAYYDYEVTGDPAATQAEEHRIVRLRNHDNQTITQNIYDPLGRVGEQWMHGDTNKTFVLRYTGTANTELTPNGDTTTYLYDERGRSLGTRDALGGENRWNYDGQDRVIRRLSAEGEETVYTYDVRHNLRRIDFPRGGGSQTNSYDTLDRLTRSTDPDGYATELVYFTGGTHTGKNRPQKIIAPGSTNTLVYIDSGAAAGRLWKTTDGDGRVTEITYDTNGHPDWTKAPGGFLTDSVYAANGNLQQQTDPKGIRTVYAYNARRQPVRITYDSGGANEAIEEFFYDNQGQLVRTLAPADLAGQRVEQRTEYSPTLKPLRQFLRNETADESDDLVVEYGYDGNDWLIRSADALGRETLRSYFDNGDLQQILSPLNRATTFTYDQDGRMLSQTSPGSPASRTTAFQYLKSSAAAGDQTDGFPKTVVTDALGNEAVSESDRRGNLRFYTNKKGHLFEMRTDGLGRTTDLFTPLGQHTQTTYTPGGDIERITEPSGQTATFAYDPTSGRLSSATYSDGTNSTAVSYTAYDSNGNLLALSENGQSISNTYDRLNRLTGRTDGSGNQVQYRYHADGRIAKLIYPGGSETGVGHVEYTYRQTGRLYQVIDRLSSTSSPRITTFHWLDDGSLSRVERPNGSQRRISYDAAGAPSLIEEIDASGNLIALFKLSRHSSGETAGRYALPVPQSSGTPGAVNAMTYDAANQLASFEGQAVTHDADGNQTFGPLPDGTFGTFSYDIRNRLLSAGGVTNRYDPQGLRTSMTDASGDTTFVYDTRGMSKVLVRTKGSSSVRSVWGFGLLYDVDENGDAVYYHYDERGNTIALTDDSATVTDRMEYAPYGLLTHRQGTTATPFLFGGLYGIQTDSSGLLQMRARFYNPLTRRFLNADPARDGWNWYAYANGNPVDLVDPLGLGPQQTGFSKALDWVQGNNTVSSVTGIDSNYRPPSTYQPPKLSNYVPGLPSPRPTLQSYQYSQQFLAHDALLIGSSARNSVLAEANAAPFAAIGAGALGAVAIPAAGSAYGAASSLALDASIKAYAAGSAAAGTIGTAASTVVNAGLQNAVLINQFGIGISEGLPGAASSLPQAAGMGARGLYDYLSD